MANYLRYFILLILLGSLFYSYPLRVEQSTIQNALDKKLPIAIDKKGFLLTLNHIDVIAVSNNIVESELNSTIQVSHNNKFSKFLPKKSINFIIHSKSIPKLQNNYLSFEILSFKINKLIKVKEVKGLLKRKIEAIKIPIKTLKKFSWFASVNSIQVHDDGDLDIKLGLSKWIVLTLIPLFLLREIGLFTIFIYQKFLSPRKKYRCAKGELYQKGTCSSTTKEAFKKGGFIAGMKAYRNSTKQCKEAYKKLKKDERRDNISCCDVPFCSGCGGDNLCSTSSRCDVISCNVG